MSTAVRFLQNAKVRQSPLDQRRAFLEKKGKMMVMHRHLEFQLESVYWVRNSQAHNLEGETEFEMEQREGVEREREKETKRSTSERDHS